MRTSPHSTTFGDLRAVLHEPSSHAARWHALLFVLQDAQAGGWLDEALTYAEDHLRAWPDAAREVPRWWWPILARDELPVGWTLARRMVWRDAWVEEGDEGEDARIYHNKLEADLGARGALAHLTELMLFETRGGALVRELSSWTPNLRALQIGREWVNHAEREVALDKLALPALERLEVIAWRVTGLELSRLPALHTLTLPLREDTLRAIDDAPDTLRTLRWFNASGDLRAALEHPRARTLDALEVDMRTITTSRRTRSPEHPRDDDALLALAAAPRPPRQLRLRGITSALPAAQWLDALMHHPTLDLADALRHTDAPPSPELAHALQEHLGAPEGQEVLDALIYAHHISGETLCAMVDAGCWQASLSWRLSAREAFRFET